MDQYNSLLQRQLKKYFSGPDNNPYGLKSFIHAVNSAYHDYETDLSMLQHSLDLSSEELLQANSELTAIFQAFPDILLRIDGEGKIVDCKGGSAIDAHIPLTQLLGKRVHEIPVKEIARKFTAALKRLKKAHSVYVTEYSYTRNSEVLFYEARFIPMPEDHSVVVIRNITERKHMETALVESERRLADIINFLPDATFAADLDGKIIAWNHATEEITGYSAEQMIGKSDHSIAFYGYRRPMLIDAVLNRSSEIDSSYAYCNKEGDVFVGETYIETEKGHSLYCWIKVSPLYNSDGDIIGAIETVRDISERKKAESVLLESGERLQKQQATLVELAHNKTLFWGNLNLAIREITEAAARTLDIAQVSVWLYDEKKTHLSCVDLYQRNDCRHSEGLDLRIPESPSYINAIEQGNIILVSDVFADTRTQGYSDSYYLRYGIGSTLDVPILVSGHTVGVVCHEHMGGQREWKADEQSFAGSIADLISLSIEVSERRKAESHLRIRTSAMNAATDQIVITDIQGRVDFVNPSFERETGFTLGEIEGKLADFLTSDKHDPAFYSNLWNTILDGKTWHGEITLYRRDGNTVVEDVTITPIKNENGTVERFIAIKRNVTEKKLYERQLDHLAHHDHLTGLPNRLLFCDRLTQCLVNAERQDAMLAVLFLDLDRFKLVNDSLGHSIGDLLLKAAAERLQDCLRDADTIARMGGDEFTAILSDITSPNDVAAVTRRLCDAISAPFLLEGQELFVTASIGVSLYPNDGTDVEALVKNADSAMYRAKEKGRNNYQFYTQALNATAVKRIQLETCLRRAVERHEFVLHYQPRVDVCTGKILGAEALVRWMHPKLGLISPTAFIPMAEETGLITSIGEWVLETACAQNKQWQDKGYDPISIAVNVSARQFISDNLIGDVKRVLKETGLKPEHLDLELTESTLMHSIDLAVSALGKLKEMGVRLSIDDFGTGYSSLTYLKRFPIDAVKIDQSFVRDLTTNSDDAAIARAVIAMSQSLKLKVIAEGVETIDQLEFLRCLECDEIQGFLASKPVPAEEFEKYLRDNVRLIDNNCFSLAA